VHEVINGQTVLDGRVEVFDLIGHPKAKRVYTWSQEVKDDVGDQVCFGSGDFPGKGR